MTQKEEFNKALEILEEIEENVGVCCAVTMEPDEVLELIDKLKEILEKYKNEYSKGNIK
jgi:tetrahydromethanopterin S-methyltransferase subunit G|tara:strand:- start:133 stop:309 length:177 start_codon:yes stop_codon:yes gene_type:complete